MNVAKHSFQRRAYKNSPWLLKISFEKLHGRKGWEFIPIRNTDADHVYALIPVGKSLLNTWNCITISLLLRYRWEIFQSSLKQKCKNLLRLSCTTADYNKSESPLLTGNSLEARFPNCKMISRITESTSKIFSPCLSQGEEFHWLIDGRQQLFSHGVGEGRQ